MRTTRRGQLNFEYRSGHEGGISRDSDPVAVANLRAQCDRWLDEYRAELVAENHAQARLIDQLMPPTTPETLRRVGL